MKAVEKFEQSGMLFEGSSSGVRSVLTWLSVLASTCFSKQSPAGSYTFNIYIYFSY